MKRRTFISVPATTLVALGLLLQLSIAPHLAAVDKLIGIHSARVLSQSLPWIAREAGRLI